MYKAMTIAGSDTSGGAGMEADLKTFQELGVYGMTALTCIVAQNPNADWAHEIYPIETAVIEKQLVTILQGIGCDAMKTGMLGSADLVELIAATIDKYELKNIVIDPVMVCKGIDTIMVPEAAAAIKELLVKRALVMTPNLLEAAYLADMPAITNVDEMKQAAAVIHEKGCKNVIMKAGDRLPGNDAVELRKNVIRRFPTPITMERAAPSLLPSPPAWQKAWLSQRPWKRLKTLSTPPCGVLSG